MQNKLEVKVGEHFQIKGQTATHIEGRLVFPEKAFRLISEEREPLPTKNGVLICGVRPKQVYTLEALTEGNDFFVKYQGLNPPWKKDYGEVAYEQIYIVNVRGK